MLGAVVPRVVSAEQDPSIRCRRPFPGAPFALSEIAFAALPTDGRFDPSEVVQRLRRARAAGVTTFDVADVQDPALAETLLARAFPSGDPTVVVIARAPRHDAPPSQTFSPRATPSPRPLYRDDGEATGRSAITPLRHVFEVDAAALRSAAERPPASPFGERENEAIVRCTSPEQVSEQLRSGRAPLLSGTFSLLDHGLADTAVRSAAPATLSWIARDPLASGRLDGRRFAASTVSGFPAPPASVRELGAEFAPVARLAFLGRAGRRTLAQAALRYVLDRPWVVSAALPLPPMERWQEILGFRASLPFEEDDWSRLGEAPVAAAAAEGVGR